MSYKKLKEECYIVMGQSPKSSTYNTEKKGIAFLQGRKTFGRMYHKIDTWTTNPIRIGKKKSVLMSVRAPAGDINIAIEDICIGRGLASISMKNNNNLYLYYLLLYNMNNIKNRSTGTVFESIAKEDIDNLLVNFHKEREQNKIQKILGNLDEKIELNNEINDNLFEIIKQYIKEHYYNDSNIQVNLIRTIGKIQGGYAFKSKDLLDEATNNKILKIKNINSSGVDIENTQYVYDEVANKVGKKFVLTRGDIIIAMTGAELGKTGYLYGDKITYFLNQRVGVIRGNDEFSNLYLNCVFLLDEMQNLLNSKGYGSAQPNISTSDIESIEIPIPDEIELKKFYKIANPIYNKMILNSEENQNLIELRDTLLPKLMNGEIDLENIEI